MMQLLELLVTRSTLVQYILMQHLMIMGYHTLTIYFFKTTLGKTLTGMRVVSNQMALLPNGAVEARGPTFYNAAVRAMMKTATWLCAIVFIAGAIEPSGQCVHDQLAGTLVVRRPTWGERDTELDLAGGLGPGTDGLLVVSKNEELYIINEKLCIKNEELCIKIEEFCIIMMNFAAASAGAPAEGEGAG